MVIVLLHLNGIHSSNCVFFKSNQIFHDTRCITPNRVTSLRGLFPRHCDQATQLQSKKYCSGGKQLITLCPIWPAQDLNLRPSAPETNALQLNQLAACVFLTTIMQSNVFWVLLARLSSGWPSQQVDNLVQWKICVKGGELSSQFWWFTIAKIEQ